MDRALFKRQMALDLPVLSNDFKETLNNTDNIMRKSIEKDSDKFDPKKGDINLIVTIEEMSELQKEITKYIRGIGDKDGIIEELADVLLSIRYLFILLDISEEDVEKARYIKLKRLKERLSDNI